MAAIQAEHFKRLDLTGEQVLRELARIGFSDIRQLFTWKTVKLQASDPRTVGAKDTW